MKSRGSIVAAVAVAVVTLGVYAATLAPTVSLVDSGELIVAAWSAGVPHPPGFPLYTMLAHLATRVPIGDVAARVNAMSAFFAALACGVVALAAAVIASQPASTSSNASRKKAASIAAAIDPLAAVCAAVTGGLTLGLSRAFWSFATIAEVYTLNTLMIALVVLVLLHWRAEVADGRRRDEMLVVAAVLFGLALGVHHVTVLVWVPGLALLVWSTVRRQRIRRGTYIWIAVAGLAGLSVYAYLPIAAARGPLMNWGDPDSAGRFLRHVSGWVYQSNLSTEGGRLGDQVVEFLRIAGRQYGPWWLPAGFALVAAGAVRLWHRDRMLLAAFGLVASCAIAYALAYDIAEDTDAYYLPVFVVFALGAGSGAVELLDLARTYAHVALAPIAIAFAITVIVFGNWSYSNRRDDFVARDYVRNTLASIEPGGMLLTEDWQLYSPMRYSIDVAGERPDVIAIDVNLLRRSWYVESMVARYPDVFAAATPDVTVYLQDLREWEANPRVYAADAKLSSRIDGRFRGMILALATAHARRAPVYVTQDLIVANTALAQAVGGNWQAVPHGLVFRLYTDRAFHEPPPLSLETRSLTDSSRRAESDDVAEVKVRPAYAGMLVNRGLYFAVNGHHDRAIEAAEAALAIDPDDASAMRLKSQLTAPAAP